MDQMIFVATTILHYYWGGITGLRRLTGAREQVGDGAT